MHRGVKDASAHAEVVFVLYSYEKASEMKSMSRKNTFSLLSPLNSEEIKRNTLRMCSTCLGGNVLCAPTENVYRSV